MKKILVKPVVSGHKNVVLFENSGGSGGCSCRPTDPFCVAIYRTCT